MEGLKCKALGSTAILGLKSKSIGREKSKSEGKSCFSFMVVGGHVEKSAEAEAVEASECSALEMV